MHPAQDYIGHSGTQMDVSKYVHAYISAQLHAKSSFLACIARANMMPSCRPEEHAVTLQATHPQLGKLKF